MSKGRLIVLTGPSGVGKGTLLRSLLQRHEQLYLSVSVTTRSPRPGEVEGKNYYYVTRPQFERMVAQGEFLEWAEFAGNCYGTPRRTVEEKVREGRWVILEIELDGARQIRKSFPSALQIFIAPPSMVELESRIRGRGQDSEAAIVRRMERAWQEVDAAGEFDLQVVNDDLERAVGEIEQTLFKPVAAVC